MQEKFRPSIRYFPEIITVAQRMVRLSKVLSWCLHNFPYKRLLSQIQAARVLEIPVIATEQYPKGLFDPLIDFGNVTRV